MKDPLIRVLLVRVPAGDWLRLYLFALCIAGKPRESDFLRAALEQIAVAPSDCDEFVRQMTENMLRLAAPWLADNAQDRLEAIDKEIGHELRCALAAGLNEQDLKERFGAEVHSQLMKWQWERLRENHA
jgi:hypothetical protein